MDKREKQLFSADDIRRSLVRIGKEIIERNGGLQDVMLVGVHRKGVPLARRIADTFLESEGLQVLVGQLDVTLYRDDLSLRRHKPTMQRTSIPDDLQGKIIVLVDDVFYTGRTVRAALNALIDIGRPDRIQLAVLVDRGHRELPIRADFVGKNVPTSRSERVQVRLRELDATDDEVVIMHNGEENGTDEDEKDGKDEKGDA
jgi:pyrimidine operon attenuation protein/uracil phosphoribosyltransferase